MRIRIFGNSDMSRELLKRVNNSASELGLSDFIEVDETTDEKLKEELGIKSEPALIIEEEEIDFKDVIFEGIVPEEEEIKSMFISIIGGGEGGCGDGGCSSGGCSDGSCSTGGCC